jgi:hypothetical protein
MNTIEGNKLIAEFMGAEFIENFGSYKFHYMEDSPHFVPKTMQYHSSWDWQLGAYKKMRNILQEFHKQDKHTVRKGDLIEVEYTLALMNVDIGKCFEHLVQLIEWYNSE